MNISKGQRFLGMACFLTLAFCVFEFVGGKLSQSLALIADAGHMLADFGALGLAFFASIVATKRPTRRMSYGFYRIEVLSALINGVLLVTLAIWIVKEAFERLTHPLVIQSQLMIAVACVGLIFNLLIGYSLKRYAHESINAMGAFFHVISDALSSVGTVLAGILIAMTGWRYIDPVISCGISLLIGLSAWRLLKDVAEVLLEAVPARIDVDGLERKIKSLAAVRKIHDLHIWSISPGNEALSAHVEVENGRDRDQVLYQINEILSTDFKIYHTTLQISTEEVRKQRNKHFHG